MLRRLLEQSGIFIIRGFRRVFQWYIKRFGETDFRVKLAVQFSFEGKPAGPPDEIDHMVRATSRNKAITTALAVEANGQYETGPIQRETLRVVDVEEVR